MNKAVLHTISYLLAGLSGLGLAVFVASQWVTPSHSQQGPAVPPPPPSVSEGAVPPPPPATDQSADSAPTSNPPSNPPSIPAANQLPPPVAIPPVGSEPVAVGNNSVADDVGTTLRTFLAPFIYQADSRRDPFRPFSALVPKMDGAVAGPLLPLQRFALDELSLIGIIWDVRKPKAMFSDPEKRIHILEKDDRVGRSNGYIAVIREGEVVVVETVNIRGELEYSTRVLTIAK